MGQNSLKKKIHPICTIDDTYHLVTNSPYSESLAGEAKTTAAGNYLSDLTSRFIPYYDNCPVYLQNKFEQHPYGAFPDLLQNKHSNPSDIYTGYLQKTQTVFLIPVPAKRVS